MATSKSNRTPKTTAASAYEGKTITELSPMRQKRVRSILREEFADFFIGMTTPSPTWPGIPDQEFVNALADALIAMGQQRGSGVAILQTFIHELQDRVNQELI